MSLPNNIANIGTCLSLWTRDDTRCETWVRHKHIYMYIYQKKGGLKTYQRIDSSIRFWLNFGDVVNPMRLLLLPACCIVWVRGKCLACLNTCLSVI